ncbi:phage repressor protein, partial [Acinetobacter baumannii]
SPVAVKKWLDGTSVPTAENLKVIAKFLGVSDDWLLYGGPIEQESNNLLQLNVLDIEAFKKKYNIPDSEDAVKFLETPV